MNPNETARKIVGDYVISVLGFPSISGYDRMKGSELVAAIEKELDAAKLQIETLKNEEQDTRNQYTALKHSAAARIAALEQANAEFEATNARLTEEHNDCASEYDKEMQEKDRLNVTLTNTLQQIAGMDRCHGWCSEEDGKGCHAPKLAQDALADKRKCDDDFHDALCDCPQPVKRNHETPPVPSVQRDLVPPLPGGAAPVNSSCCMPHTPGMSCCCGCHTR